MLKGWVDGNEEAGVPPARARWSEADAREVIEAWRRTGQTMSAFVREHGLQADRLPWWRRRLGEWSPSAPVELTAAVVSAEAKDASAQRLVIRIAEEVTIEVANPTPSWVAALVSELSRGRRDLSAACGADLFRHGADQPAPFV